MGQLDIISKCALTQPMEEKNQQWAQRSKCVPSCFGLASRPFLSISIYGLSLYRENNYSQQQKISNSCQQDQFKVRMWISEKWPRSSVSRSNVKVFDTTNATCLAGLKEKQNKNKVRYMLHQTEPKLFWHNMLQTDETKLEMSGHEAHSQD